MTFILAHLSDPHIGPLPNVPLLALLNKRLLGSINWHSRRATLHDMAVLDHVIDDILAQKPDHIALTGDLVNIGYGSEFSRAFAQLERLGQADQVSIVPGNHDAYVRDSLPAMAAQFHPFMRGDDASGAWEANGLPPYPYLRRRENIALIGINSALPTGPLMATGRVETTELSRLGSMLESLAKEDVTRVIMIHHPPYQGGARFARGMVNAAAFESVIAQYGAELIIHGHNHRFSSHFMPTPTGKCPVIGVGSASAVPGTPHHCAEYNLFFIEREKSHMNLRIQKRGVTASNHNVTLLAEMQI